MGAEQLLLLLEKDPQAPLILGLQVSALVDHVARVDRSLLDQMPGDRGGSQQVAAEDLKHILSKVNSHILSIPNDSSPMRTMAGGSIANTIRGLAAGFGVSCGLIVACGDDEHGRLFVSNMSFNGVNLSRLRMKNGPTAQCACLVDADGNRTMRPCLLSAVRLQISLMFSSLNMPFLWRVGSREQMLGILTGICNSLYSQADELTRDDFKGSRWLALRYGFYHLELIRTAVRIAKEEGLFVSMDLASFEVIFNNEINYSVDGKHFLLSRIDVLELQQATKAACCWLCFGKHNMGEPNTNPEAALEFLAKYCRWAVVTLGANGCIAKHGREESIPQVVQVPAIGEAQAVDATGAGDLFASGFLYGLVNGLPLEDCCKVGSCSGGSVIRFLGGEVRSQDWQWMYKQMKIKGIPVPDGPDLPTKQW
ncbi:hypothetical protein ACLOJK_001813 [Asimina triloba]